MLILKFQSTITAAIAQLAARRSHNPKVVSSILTGRILQRQASADQVHSIAKFNQTKNLWGSVFVFIHHHNKPPAGFEPATSRLLSGCSTN